MANDLVWDKRMLRTFIEEACLTEEEEIVLEDWIKGKHIANTSMLRHMSESKINKIRKSIRMKYDRVQVYTPELPKRTTRL